jgi:hypothetical protein
MGPRDVFVTVQESGGRTRGFPERPRPFDLERASSHVPACLRGPSPFVEYRIAFRDGGRAFYVLAAVGRHATPADRSDLLAVLESLQVDAAPGVRRMDPDSSVFFDHNGITGLLPEAWRLERRPLTATPARGQLAFGSYPVPPGPRAPACAPPQAALDALGAGGVFVFIFEYRSINARQLARFPARPLRFRLGVRQSYECFGVSHLVRWREAGRAFQAHVYLGPRAGAAGRRDVLAVLDNLRVRPRARG